MYIFVCLVFYLFCDALAIPAIETKLLNEANEDAKNQTDADGDALFKEIKDLERQRNDLYKEINKAIDDSITALSESNDTDAITGVNYIKDLKKQMKEFNDTEDTADVIYSEYDKRVNTSILGTDKGILLDQMKNGDHIDPRRNMRTKHNEISKLIQASSGPNANFLKAAQKQLDELLYKGLKGKKLKERLERREKIRAQLEEWITMKEREREKIKQYTNRQKTYVEQCPRSGFTRQKSKNRQNRPCCRKCCKRSYLGCLKK